MNGQPDIMSKKRRALVRAAAPDRSLPADLLCLTCGQRSKPFCLCKIQVKSAVADNTKAK